MNKVKTVKYHKSVPQEIKDLMGDKQYKFITGSYQTQYWRNTNIMTPTPLTNFQETL